MEREIRVIRNDDSDTEHVSCTDCTWGDAVEPVAGVDTESEVVRLFNGHNCADFIPGNDHVWSREFTLSCSECGSNDVPIPDEAPDDTPITCSTCGADLGSLGDARAKVEGMARKNFQESLKATIREAFEGVEGITFTETE
jgi:hypothetical protein